MEKIKVLVVDDEEGIREFLVDYLPLYGFEVILAANATEAVEKNKTEKPVLALLDMILPEDNGLNVFRAFKVDNPNIKVVLMTGFPVDDLIEQAIKEGAISYIFKPFELENVLEILQNIVAQELRKR